MALKNKASSFKETLVLPGQMEQSKLQMNASERDCLNH
jgi:hypothetical protein